MANDPKYSPILDNQRENNRKTRLFLVFFWLIILIATLSVLFVYIQNGKCQKGKKNVIHLLFLKGLTIILFWIAGDVEHLAGENVSSQETTTISPPPTTHPTTPTKPSTTTVVSTTSTTTTTISYHSSSHDTINSTQTEESFTENNHLSQETHADIK